MKRNVAMGWIMVFAGWFFLLQSQNLSGTQNLPLWTKTRPNSAFKYVGIGFCEKSKGQGYRMEAKKNALFDLASEIKVDISSNSVLYSVQNNNQYNESFNSLIKLSNSDNLEGYQLVDSYEDQDQYWVYYQLDKEDYAKIKAQKKQRILDQSAQLLGQAKNEEKSGILTPSLTKRLQAFALIVPYLNEEIKLNTGLSGGCSGPSDITSLIQNQLQDLVIESKEPVLKPLQPTYLPVSLEVRSKKGASWAQLPFLVKPESEHVAVEVSEAVNSQNKINIKFTEIGNDVNTSQILLEPDLKTLLKNDSSAQMCLKVLQRFIPLQPLSVSFRVEPVRLFIKSETYNLGRSWNTSDLQNAVLNKLQGTECTWVNSESESDLVIQVTAQTQEANDNDWLLNQYNLQLVNLLLKVKVLRKSDASELLNLQYNDIYGYSNSLERAGANAFTSHGFNERLAEIIFEIKHKIFQY